MATYLGPSPSLSPLAVFLASTSVLDRAGQARGQLLLEEALPYQLEVRMAMSLALNLLSRQALRSQYHQLALVSQYLL